MRPSPFWRVRASTERPKETVEPCPSNKLHCNKKEHTVFVLGNVKAGWRKTSFVRKAHAKTLCDFRAGNTIHLQHSAHCTAWASHVVCHAGVIHFDPCVIEPEGCDAALAHVVRCTGTETDREVAPQIQRSPAPAQVQ